MQPQFFDCRNDTDAVDTQASINWVAINVIGDVRPFVPLTEVCEGVCVPHWEKAQHASGGIDLDVTGGTPRLHPQLVKWDIDPMLHAAVDAAKEKVGETLPQFYEWLDEHVPLDETLNGFVKDDCSGDWTRDDAVKTIDGSGSLYCTVVMPIDFPIGYGIHPDPTQSEKFYKLFH